MVTWRNTVLCSRTATGTRRMRRLQRQQEFTDREALYREIGSGKRIPTTLLKENQQQAKQSY